MHRSPRPFTSFQPAHRILSPTSPGEEIPRPPYYNSQNQTTRARPSTADSVDSLASESDFHTTRSQLHAQSKKSGVQIVVEEMARPESPLWDGVSSNSVPLLPVGRNSRGEDGKTYEQNMLSRSPSPYPFGTDQDGEGASMLGGGSRGGKVHGRWHNFSSWFKRGKLGWWLWNTQRGWAVFVTALIILNGGSGVLLLSQNQVLMRTGVYK